MRKLGDEKKVVDWKARLEAIGEKLSDEPSLWNCHECEDTGFVASTRMCRLGYEATYGARCRDCGGPAQQNLGAKWTRPGGEPPF